MNGLATSGLITMDEASCIESTDAGRLMSIYYLDVETMKNIMKIDGTENLERLLILVCDSHELSDMHLRVDERRCLNALNRNNTAATIRFPMKGKISTRQMKLNCMIQAVLGCLPIPDPSLNQEAMKVMRIADRICKCLVAYVTRQDLVSQQPQYFSAVLNSIILAKCVTAHLWENSPFVSKQLKGIGPAFSALLAAAGKVNFTLLEESHPRDLERIMNKGPPAGNTLRKQISFLPKYDLTITPKSERTITIKLVLQNLCYLAENMEHLTAGEAHKTYLIVGDSDNYLLLLTSFKDKDLIKVYDGSITYEITRKRNYEHKIFVHCVSTNFVGIDAQCEFTFRDLETPIHANLQANTKKITQRQPCITDAFKERKRKNENSANVPQHKDKRKRDSSLLQKFNNLKEPFKETFDILNKHIRQTTMSPGKARLHEISYADNTQTYDMSNQIIDRDIVNVNSVTSNTMETVINIDDSDEEYINDDKINKLLDKIESEISEVKKTTRTQVPFPKPILDINKVSNNQIKETTPSNASEINIHKSDIIPSITGKFRSDIDTHATMQRVRKAKNVKSNYSFIDIIQKNDATFDENDNSIVTDNAIGFSTAIKSNLDKYLETIQHSSKNSNDIINIMFQNTDDYNISKRSMVQKVTESNLPQVDTTCNRLDENFKSNSLHDNNIETAAGADNLNYIVHASIAENKLSTGSRQTDKFAPANIVMQSNNLSSSKTFTERLQNKSLIASITGRQTHENDLNRESNIYDTKINNVLSNINQINDYSNFENKNLMIQGNEFPENSKYKKQRINENILNDVVHIDQDNDILDSNKINQLTRELFNIENNPSRAECVSKYSFTATSISVQSSTENFVHVIKKLKINLDIVSKNVPANKIIINNTINITSDAFCKAYDRNSVKDINKPTNAELPSICKAKKSTGSVSSENCKEIDHFKLNQDDRNEMENMTINVNTKPDTYKVKGDQIISSFDTDLKETTNDGTIQNSEIVTLVKEFSKDDGMYKELTNLTRIDLDQVTNSNNTTGFDQEKTPAQKSGVNKVADILKKYSTILRKKNDKQDINKVISSIHRNINSQDVKKSERPFKISDIQKLNVVLPKGMTNEISADKYVPPKFLIVRKNTSEDEEKIANVPFTCTDDAKQLEPPKFVNEFEKKYFENVDSELQWVSENCQEPISDFNIHESMFDPKTLLQCLDNDISNEIIPPPPEFSDKVDDHCVGEITAITSDIENNVGIFQDEGDLELTPCKEIETWTISPRIGNFVYTNQNLIGSCTTMNRNQSTRKKLHIPAVSRRNKLNQFKFSQKNKMII